MSQDSDGIAGRLTARIADIVARWPRAIIGATAALVAIGAVFAVGAPSALSPAGYEVPDADRQITAVLESGKR